MEQLKCFQDMPGPYGYPLIGSAPHLLSFPEKTLLQWANDLYGNVFRYRMLQQQCIALNGYDAVVEGLVTRGSDMSGRIVGELIEATRDNRGVFYVEHGQFWQKWKDFAVRSVGAIMPEFTLQIEKEANKLSSGLLDTAAKNGDPVQLENELVFRCAQVMFLATMGKEFAEDERKILNDVISQVYAPVIAIKYHMLRFAPGLSRFPPFSWFLTNQRAERVKLVKKLVEWTDQQHDVDDGKSSSDDILSCFHQSSMSKSQEEKESLAVLFIDFIFAGSTTVTQELMWMLLFLMKHPEVMKRVQEEIDVEMEEAESVSALFKAGGKATYTRATIQEVMRLRPIAPGSLVHKTTTDTNVGGYKVPKGVVVFPNLWSVHHDPKLWAPDPDTFRPERHIDDEGRFIKSKYVIPYSVGERQCAGKMIADAEIFIFLVTVVQKYQISLSKANVDMNGSSAVTLRPPEFSVIVSYRR